MSEISEKIRKEWKQSDDKRDEGLVTPSDIIRFNDIQYGNDSVFNVLDVYKPVDADESIPVILNVHGGGWVYGTKETYQFYGMDLAQKGFAVVNFTYRLAPENKFPACIEDTNLVVKWIFENAEEYGFDLNNFFATGDSAGAHILSLYTAALTNKDYAANFNFALPDNFCFKAIILNCGKYSFKDFTAEQTDLMKELLNDIADKKEMDLIEAIDFITEKFPPCFLMTCTGDFLKHQSVLLANKFVENNVPFELQFIKSNEMDLWHCFQNSIRLEDGILIRKTECDYFKKFITD